MTSARLGDLLESSQAALQNGRCADGAALARQAVDLAVELDDRVAQAAALGLLARQLTRIGEFEPTVAVCDRAAVILRDLDDQAGLCDILIVQALALNELGLSEEALDVLGVGREVATRLKDPALLYWVLNRIAVVHAGMRDYSRAHAFQLRALELSAGLDEDARFCILNNISCNVIGLSRQLREEGEEQQAGQILQEGLGFADEAMKLAVSSANPYRQTLALDNRGMLLGLSGRYAAALEQLAVARDLAVERGYASLEVGAVYHAASVLLLQGRADEAVSQLSAVLDRATGLDEPALHLGVLLDLSQALELTGDYAGALRRYKEWVARDRQARSAVAAARARMLVQLVDLDVARLDVADAREESQLYLDRSRQLEAEKRELEALAADLDRRANEDALTKLSNRHHLETELPRIVAETVAEGLPLAVMVLDLDHFKRVNDTFGHAVGDAVLVQVAELLNRGRRSGDLIARMGGEEFLGVFPGLDEDSAVKLCQRLRRDVENHDWSSLRPGLRVTASLGVCARAGETSGQHLVEQADLRMYQAKRAGRNRVEW